MIARDWATVDLYAVLGVARGASSDEITEAFRSLAKRLHPDVVAAVAAVARTSTTPSSTSDSLPSDRFIEISAAYEVLSDPRQRADYDEVRSMRKVDALAAQAEADVQSTVGRRESTWSPHRARWAIVGGVLVFAAGVAFSVFIVQLGHREARDLAARIEAIATVVRTPTETQFVFSAADSRAIVVPQLTNRRGSPLHDGQTVTVHYRQDDPTDIRLDANNGGRDLAFWFVAIKLLVAGPILVGFGVARLRSRGSRTR